MAQRVFEQKVVGFLSELEKILAFESSDPEHRWLQGVVSEMRQMNFFADPYKEVRVVQEVIESCALQAKDKKLSEKFYELYHQLFDLRLESVALQNSLQPQTF